MPQSTFGITRSAAPKSRNFNGLFGVSSGGSANQAKGGFGNNNRPSTKGSNNFGNLFGSSSSNSSIQPQSSSFGSASFGLAPNPPPSASLGFFSQAPQSQSQSNSLFGGMNVKKKAKNISKPPQKK
eukprot:TRINITY_DN6677_c0_g1_i1.p1 TRINITY_DN6677_c0_g1~~TRINITY_DN6677_c0_g1_i1.p1  ORF type:complete len:126 (-),score=4.14 TRINITY_DN6677_c0_g1_i1:647-1024(-)